MIRDHKKTLILASLATLLPIPVGLLLWDKFPVYIASHWGFYGQPDGWTTVPFTVFVMPCIMLAVFWLCVLITAKDPGNQGRNKKPLALVFWIMPILSNLCSGMMYALALGAEFSVSNLMVAFMGILFALIGNYLPKCRMNSTMGIKVPWAYSSEANWNATHRFGGRVWLVGGIAMVLSAFVPGEFTVTVMLIALVVLAVIPIVYSYRFYKKEKAEGKALLPMFSQKDATILKVSAIAVVLILAGVAVLMFTGNIEVEFQEEFFSIKASYYEDLTVAYGVVEDVEYREGNVPGIRTMGYGSARLLMGWFENEEFGIYTRYTYFDPEACVVITTKDQVLVLSGEDAAETQKIYQTLLTRTGK